MRFLLLTLRTLWQSALLLLVPAVIALFVVTPLALLTKSALVEMQLLTNDVGFTLSAGRESGQEVDLLHVRAQEVTVNTNSLRVPVKELIERDLNKIVLGNGFVEFRSQGDKNQCEVEFNAEPSELFLQGVRLRVGSGVKIWRKQNEIRLDLSPKELVEGVILLPELGVLLTTTDCRVLNEGGGTVSGLPERPQLRFSLQPSGPSVEIASRVNTSFRVRLSSKEDENLPGAFTGFLKISNLTFSQGGDGVPTPIRQGVVTFRNIEKKDIKLLNGFIKVPTHDTFDLIAIQGRAGALDLTISGVAGSLKVGKTPDPEPEELPSLLVWIYHHQQFALLTGVLVWISGTVLAAVNLLDTLRKLGGSDSNAG